MGTFLRSKILSTSLCIQKKLCLFYQLRWSYGMLISRHQLETESQMRFYIDYTIRATLGDPHCIGATSIRVAGCSTC